MTQKTYQYVNNFWDDAEAGKQSGVDGLFTAPTSSAPTSASTNTSGGNTSSKLTDKDPLTGQTVEVLWVKGSAATSAPPPRKTFRRFYQQKLLDLQKTYAARKTRASSRGPRTTW